MKKLDMRMIAALLERGDVEGLAEAMAIAARLSVDERGRRILFYLPESIAMQMAQILVDASRLEIDD